MINGSDHQATIERLESSYMTLLTQFAKVKQRLEAVQCYCPVSVQDGIRELIAEATAIIDGGQQHEVTHG